MNPTAAEAQKVGLSMLKSETAASNIYNKIKEETTGLTKPQYFDVMVRVRQLIDSDMRHFIG